MRLPCPACAPRLTLLGHQVAKLAGTRSCANQAVWCTLRWVLRGVRGKLPRGGEWAQEAARRTLADKTSLVWRALKASSSPCGQARKEHGARLECASSVRLELRKRVIPSAGARAARTRAAGLWRRCSSCARTDAACTRDCGCWDARLGWMIAPECTRLINRSARASGPHALLIRLGGLCLLLHCAPWGASAPLRWPSDWVCSCLPGECCSREERRSTHKRRGVALLCLRPDPRLALLSRLVALLAPRARFSRLAQTVSRSTRSYANLKRPQRGTASAPWGVGLVQ